MIHHTLFADDILFIYKADDIYANGLMSILNVYENATEQMVNLEKLIFLG